MGTNFENIYSLAKVVMNDYKIDQLALSNYNSFLELMRSYLISSLGDFDGNLTPLTYHSETTTEQVVVDGNETTVEKTEWYFDNVLSTDEISILADLTVMKWFQTTINDITAFSPHLSNKDFKQLQESQSLKQKSDYYDKLYERVHKKITEYQLKRLGELKYWGDRI